MIVSTILFLAAALSVEGRRRLPNDGPIATPSHDHLHGSEGRRRLLHEVDGHVRGPLHPPQQQKEQQQQPSSRRTEEPPNPDSHLVTSMPLLPPNSFPTKHWAGHLPASQDASDKKIFYWLFEPGQPPSGNPDEIPLVLWINGGPGCSSMDGLWLENGPFRLTQGGGAAADNGWKIDVNPHSWHNAAAWTLYVDQPVGTGLSFTRKKNYCKNDFEVNRDFHYFLEELFLFHRDKFLIPLDKDNSPAQWTMKRPFYFSGESHAGHYIPSMMDYILRRNDGEIVPEGANGLVPLRVNIPCSGAAIGNGWIDPFHQYAAADAAYGAGLIGTAQRASLQDKEKMCQKNLKSGNYRSSVCFALLDDIVDQSAGSGGSTKVSQYDTRLWEKRSGARTFPQGHKEVETYLGGARPMTNPPIEVNYKDVLAAIHAEESIDAGLTYRECTDPPYLALQNQDGLGVVDELVRVLDHPSTPHMLFFNGINDLICNHVGNEQLLDNLPWSKTEQYTQQPRHAWQSGVEAGLKMNYIPGRPDGYIKQFGNLSFLKIMEAGHMVPMDQPAVSLAMMRTLVYGSGGNKGGFLSSQQNLARADTNKEARMCGLDQCPDCLPSASMQPAAPGGAAGAISMSAASPLWSSLGIVIAAFASGILFTCLCQRHRQRASQKRVLAALDDDMELTDQDSIYRDHDDEDGEYT